MKRREFIKNTAILGGVAVSAALIPAARASGTDPHPQTIKDPKNPTSLEKKHVPLVEAPAKVKKDEWFEVRVKVGYMLPHPSTPEHWIDEIKLLVNGKEVAEIDNEAGGITSSDGCFRIRLQAPSEIKALIHCNLHGTWTGESVKVNVA